MNKNIAAMKQMIAECKTRGKKKNEKFLPCIVMPRVESDGIAESSDGFVEFLSYYILMTKKSVSIRKIGVQL